MATTILPGPQRITRSTNGTKRRRDTVLADERIAKKRKDSKNNSETEDEERVGASEQTVSLDFQRERLPLRYEVPKLQERLLLHGKKQRYQVDHTYQVPYPIEAHEILIKIQYVGLNPIDWKAPDFGFGIPWLPYIAGREFVGQVVSAPVKSNGSSSRLLREGDIVFSASTDYRDRRKAAFQEFTVAPIYNVCRIPAAVTNKSSVAGLGVAFVAAVLTLGVCIGSDFSSLGGELPVGPDLKKILRSVPAEQIPIDVREESLASIEVAERPKAGDWLAIWGGSSATANIVAQLAKHLQLRVIKVVDVAKHGARLSEGPADLIVDSHDPERAVSIIRKVTDGSLRFGVDTVGKPTAELLRRTLHSGDEKSTSHLVGLTGLPKEAIIGVKQHTVPIKIHHEVPAVGEALMVWLEKLLATGKIVPPDVELLGGGLAVVNNGLDRMRRGEISGKRLAVSLI